MPQWMGRARMNTRNLVLASLLGAAALWGQESRPASQFLVKFDLAGITSLKYAGDKYDTDYIAQDELLGHVRVRYKLGESDWRQFSTTDSKNREQRSEEHTSELQSLRHLVCRLLLEKTQ